MYTARSKHLSSMTISSTSAYSAPGPPSSDTFPAAPMYSIALNQPLGRRPKSARAYEGSKGQYCAASSQV